MVLIQTDLPDPVVPAISRCGIFPKFNVLISPEVVFPIAKVSSDFASANSGLFTTDLKKTVAGFRLGITIPTEAVSYTHLRAHET